MSLSAVAVLPTPRRHARDVLEIIRGLRRQNPRADESQLAEQLADELFEDRALLVTVARDLVHKASAPAKTKKPTLKTAETARRQRVSSQAAEKEQVAKIAANVRQRIMLDTVVALVDGGTKELRYCTAGELRDLSGVYGRIAEKVMEAGGPDAMVGEIVCARDLEEICAQSEKAPA